MATAPLLLSLPPCRTIFIGERGGKINPRKRSPMGSCSLKPGAEVAQADHSYDGGIPQLRGSPELMCKFREQGAPPSPKTCRMVSRAFPLLTRHTGTSATVPRVPRCQHTHTHHTSRKGSEKELLESMDGRAQSSPTLCLMGGGNQGVAFKHSGNFHPSSIF